MLLKNNFIFIVISNLISNAFKYTKEGKITVSCKRNANFYEFEIKDTGIGILQKDIDHIFDRFYRGSNIDESSTRGTGIGLSIVKEIVELLDDPVRRKKMGENGKKRVEQALSWSHSKQVLLKAYEAALNVRPRNQNNQPKEYIAAESEKVSIDDVA